MGEHICQYIWQGIDIQNLQSTYKPKCLKNKQPNLKMAMDLNRHFSKGNIQMANKHIETTEQNREPRDKPISL